MSKLTTMTGISAVAIANMRLMRKARGWSAERLVRELAEVGCPITRNSIVNQETRQSSQAMPLDQAVGLARVFGVTVEQLIEPTCDVCFGSPPPGFSCNACGSATQTGQPPAPEPGEAPRDVPPALVIDEIKNWPATVDLVTAAGALGIGRTKAHEMARSKRFPVRLLTIGKRYRVSTADLCEYLGIASKEEAG